MSKQIRKQALENFKTLNSVSKGLLNYTNKIVAETDTPIFRYFIKAAGTLLACLLMFIAAMLNACYMVGGILISDGKKLFNRTASPRAFQDNSTYRMRKSLEADSDSDTDEQHISSSSVEKSSALTKVGSQDGAQCSSDSEHPRSEKDQPQVIPQDDDTAKQNISSSSDEEPDTSAEGYRLQDEDGSLRTSGAWLSH